MIRATLTKHICGSVYNSIAKRTIVTRELLLARNIVSLENNYIQGNTTKFKHVITNDYPYDHINDIKKYAISIRDANNEMLLILEDFNDMLRPKKTTFWLAKSFIKEAYYSGSINGFNYIHHYLSMEDAIETKKDLVKLISSRNEMLNIINQEILSHQLYYTKRR